MNFSDALEGIKDGLRLARSGWNGTGMYVFLQPGYPGGVKANDNTIRSAGLLAHETIVIVRPYLMMRAADGTFVCWTAGHSDILGNDWEISQS